MKKIITIFPLFFFFYSNAQLFTGGGGGIQNNGQDTYFDIPVSGLMPMQLDSTFGIEQVGINISHPEVEQLYIYLRSPSGTVVELTEGSSCHGNNYSNTVFDSHLNNSITMGIPPYTGNYRPTGYLGRFNSGQPGNGTWQLIVHDYLAFVDSGMVINWSIKFGNLPSPAVKFTSSNLPIIDINTNNQVLSDLNTTVSFGIIYNGAGQRNSVTDAMNNYNGKAIMHWRGNSTKNYEKKAFSVQTVDAAGVELNASLLGMPPENDWDLIAMYQDKSLIRVPVAYDLSRKMGHYSPRFKMVEVVINNEYQGVYLLVEKPKWGSFRIDIPKLTSTDNSVPLVTGGYIFKIDRNNVGGWYSFLPGDSCGNVHFYYQNVYPNDVNITSQQKNYIQSYMDNFETVMNSSSFGNLSTGYPNYIDKSSFIDYFIINELSKNVDAYRLSTFLYKDNIAQGGKLHIGPVWDYDLAWHNCNYGNSFDPTGWEYQIHDSVYPVPTWWNRFSQDSNFVNKLYCRWNSLRQGILSVNNLNAYIDSTANWLNESQQRNFTQWPILGAYIYPNPQNQIGVSYQSEVNDLKTWISNRIAWMDQFIPGNCTNLAVGINENNPDNISVYPNPFISGTTFSVRLTEDADVTLKLINIMGKEISVLLNKHEPSGEFKVVFDRKETASGMYFYQLKINNAIKTGKIIIQ